jgi:hypothetical protein
MPSLNLKPTHKAVAAYYDSLAKFAKLGIKYETAVRSVFHELLEHCVRQFDWKLVPEYMNTAMAEGERLKNQKFKLDGRVTGLKALNVIAWAEARPTSAGPGKRPPQTSQAL